MVNVSSGKKTEFYYIGLSMTPTSTHDSSICVIDKNNKIVHMNKLFFSDDIKLFFETSSYIKNSIVMAGLVEDDFLLDGKWRIHSKNYKMLTGGLYDINRNNWTNRLSDRLKDVFISLKESNVPTFRCNIKLLRRAYNLPADYLERTSLDCKNFQTGLKIKYELKEIQDNLLPASSLEATLCALFAKDIGQNKINFSKISEFCGIDVVNPV